MLKLKPGKDTVPCYHMGILGIMMQKSSLSDGFNRFHHLINSIIYLDGVVATQECKDSVILGHLLTIHK